MSNRGGGRGERKSERSKGGTFLAPSPPPLPGTPATQASIFSFVTRGRLEVKMNVYVVVQIYPCLNCIFPLFLGMVMYHDN